MSGESPRWQGQRSQYPWEQDALDFIKDLMPTTGPYQARQTFQFTAQGGHVREVDLLIATPGGLFLVEIKSHPGIARNNGSSWLVRDGNRVRTLENPLHFADLKAKELKSRLQAAARKIGLRERVPFITPVVFLSAENLVCEFDEFQRPSVYGRDNKTGTTTLPGIWGFLNRPPVRERDRVTAAFTRRLPELLETIGVERIRRYRKVGPYELRARAFDSGPSWEDYLASDPSLPEDPPRRVRVYLSDMSASEEDRQSTQRAALREYLALRDLGHDGIVQVERFSEELKAGPAVVFRHGAEWQRLDHFLSAQGTGLSLETRLEMVRQLAEALDYAHRRHLYHRALAPRSVYVEMDGHYPRLRIADWRAVAGAPGSFGGGTTNVMRKVDPATHVYLASETDTPGAEPGLLDIYGLGTLSYLILTGEPPAATPELLTQKLVTESALTPSAATDSVTTAIDSLVRRATQLYPADRLDTVRQFLKRLDEIEGELAAAADREPEKDPLTVVKGDKIRGGENSSDWIVEEALGRGSTSKALLVAQSDNGNKRQRVFKVALNDRAAERLVREAEQLGPLADSHVAQLIDAPFEVGPAGARRTVIGVEYIAGPTLAEELRLRAPLTLRDMERFGEDLLHGVRFLHHRQIWHRDIKPDNLVLRELERNAKELVLIDFSLAGIPDTEISVGTKGYLDPFLGTADRQRYDEAAELYAVAVTLHEMASGELPTWGDDLIDPSFLPPEEEVQLAEDLFDPVARDGLVSFFKVALQRDISQRYQSLQEMSRDWTAIFHELAETDPLTTASTVDSDSETAAERRAAANATATADTALIATGLSPHALSFALRRLNISTAGELARTPAGRIEKARGLGSRSKHELKGLAKEWRRRFNLTDDGVPRSDSAWHDQDSKTDHPERAGVVPQDTAAAESAEKLRHLSLDEVIRRLIPEEEALRVVTGLRPAENGCTVSPWADQREIARVSGIQEGEVAGHLERLRKRWLKKAPALTAVREELAEILSAHGRILGWRQLATTLLSRRGSQEEDRDERLVLAAVCVRAATEVESRIESGRLMVHRLVDDEGGVGNAGEEGKPVPPRILVALRPGPEESEAAEPDELFLYAELLGLAADELSARDPLPGVTEIRQTLREVDTASHAVRLSDTDLVLLAAAASEKTAATPRLELYPRNLDKLRSLRITQAGSVAEGAFAVDLVHRVLARFPELDEESRPVPEEMGNLLRQIGYDVTAVSGSGAGARGREKLIIRSSTQQSGSQGQDAGWRVSVAAADEAASAARDRLAQARRHGGFIALKASVRDAAEAGDQLGELDAVSGVNVTEAFTRCLHEIVREQGKPRWETVLAADSANASPTAQRGLAALLRQTWNRLEEHIRAEGTSRVVLLTDAAPLARYAGGDELLSRLMAAARDSAEEPFGLWLLCVMDDPRAGNPSLDRLPVGVIPGDAEQLWLPGGFTRTGNEQGAA